MIGTFIVFYFYSFAFWRSTIMTTNFVAKGTDIIKQAVQKDNAEEYEAALSLYTQGIQYLMTGLKYEKNQKVVGAIKEKVQKYMQRAEDIKTSLSAPPKKKKKVTVHHHHLYPLSHSPFTVQGYLFCPALSIVIPRIMH